MSAQIEAHNQVLSGSKRFKEDAGLLLNKQDLGFPVTFQIVYICVSKFKCITNANKSNVP